jgi:ricin-type beta-trefoil lectin protein
MRLRKEVVRPVARAFAGRRLRVALVTVGLALGLTSAVVAAAPADAAPAHFVIYNAHSRDCISNGGATNGYVSQFGCNGSTNQQWHWGGTSHGSYQQLINTTTGQCIGLRGNLANGATLYMGNCSSNDQYYWEEGNLCPPVGPCYIPPGWWFLQNQASLRAMQVGCNCDNNSAAIIDANPNGNGPPDQLWAVDYGDQGP